MSKYEYLTEMSTSWSNLDKKFKRIFVVGLCSGFGSVSLDKNKIS